MLCIAWRESMKSVYASCNAKEASAHISYGLVWGDKNTAVLSENDGLFS